MDDFFELLERPATILTIENQVLKADIVKNKNIIGWLIGSFVVVIFVGIIVIKIRDDKFYNITIAKKTEEV